MIKTHDAIGTAKYLFVRPSIQGALLCRNVLYHWHSESHSLAPVVHLISKRVGTIARAFGINQNKRKGERCFSFQNDDDDVDINDDEGSSQAVFGNSATLILVGRCDVCIKL